MAGGGLTGLSAAVFLAWHGVQSVVVERHADLPRRPASRAVNPRTMEVLRQVGLEHAVMRHGDARTKNPMSPCTAVSIAQDRFEGILRDRAEALGAMVCFGTELRSFDASADSVTATVVDDDGEYTVEADGSDDLGFPVLLGRRGRPRWQCRAAARPAPRTAR
ncbi:hypothetical protein AOZ06_30540 [Kibdelosporangium phytohabitans]|uniref:FAD-binding domain-containing protein n=1 Tax=Kibdelosporangium phytohabitans TaxID=860235 RepID=A0A0N9I3M3_9PSEU|nr:hypothetical protein AOZ06_30540 [Kibdelosporangium phytohabitans]